MSRGTLSLLWYRAVLQRQVHVLEGGLLKPDDTGAFTFTITIHGMGSDGADLQVHATFHDNANPNTERAFPKMMHCP